MLSEWPGFEQGSAQAVVVSGQLTAVAAESAGIHFIDFSDPTKPRRLGVAATGGEVLALAFAAEHVVATVTNHLSSSSSGMEMWNGSDPSRPMLAGRYSASRARQLAVAGNTAFLGVQGGMELIDLSDPGAPHLVGEYKPGGNLQRIVTRGDLTVLEFESPSERYRLDVVDTRDQSNPLWLSEYRRSEWPYYSGAQNLIGNTLYTSSGPWLDLSDPTKPMPTARDTTGVIHAWATGFATGAGLEIYAHPDYGLTVFDYSVAGQPKTVARLWEDYSEQQEPGRVGLGVAAAGGVAVLAGGESGVHLVDVSNPAAPTQIAAVDMGYARRIVAAGNFAYLADGHAGVRILDRSDPASPVERSRYTGVAVAEAVALTGQVLYVAGDFWDPTWLPSGTWRIGFQVVDVSNPHNPRQIGGV